MGGTGTRGQIEPPPRILVVEDEHLTALDIETELIDLGYAVVGPTATGQEALDLATQEGPDLALLDINLAGDMDGVAVGSYLRDHLQIPVIYLTAYSDPGTLARARVSGPFGYLLKPLDERNLQVTVEMALHRHRMEQELREAHAQLDQRVEERTRELQEANEELVHLNQELEQFAHVVSHDLRAPLRGMSYVVDWLSEELGDDISEKSTEYIDLLRGRIGRLDHLVRDLLSMARVTLDGGRPEQVDLGELLTDLIDELSPPPGFTVSVDGTMPTLRAYRVPLQQVLRNLIDNAIKHHDRPDGHVTISAADSGEYWILQVTDDGPGIPPEAHERVFEMFSRLAADDGTEGTGMGLALVRKLVTRHHGAITLTSEPDQGATFTVRWPKFPGNRPAHFAPDPPSKK